MEESDKNNSDEEVVFKQDEDLEGMEPTNGNVELREGLRDNLEELFALLRGSENREEDLKDFLSDFLDLQTSGEEFRFIYKQLETYVRSRLFIDGIKDARIAGKELHVIQKEAALGFYEWIKTRIFEERLMGRLVVPTGMGKTLTAVMLAEMAGGKSVFVANSKSDAAQVVKAFSDHFGEDRVAGFYGQKGTEDPKVHTVTTFFSHNKWEDIDWPNVRVMFVDEADVSALSSFRSGLIGGLAEKYGVPVIGISATERQYSGKKLEDVFPDEILRLPMPQALSKCLELGLIPEIEFNDLYVDSVLRMERKDFWAGDIGDPVITEFIRSNLWNKAIIDHYIENFRHGENDFVRGIVVFRNNILVEDFVKRAKEVGIRAMPFTGDMDQEVLELIKNRYNEGNIDLLVGSRLLGRGLDIPGINVVYNSTVTCSPQIFWQADGRGFRLDPKNASKKAKIYSVVPARVVNKRTGEDMSVDKKPLNHASFFDPDYFHGFRNREKKAVAGEKSERRKYNIVRYDMKDLDTSLTEENILRIVKGGRWGMPGFGSAAMVIARALSMLHETDLPMWPVLRSMQSFKRARRVIPALLENEEDYLAKTGDDWISRRVRNFGIEFSRQKEVKLLSEYKDLQMDDSAANKRRMEIETTIIKAYEPFAKEVCRYYAKLSKIEESAAEDLSQEVLIILVKYIRESVNYDNVRILPQFFQYLIHGLGNLMADMPQVGIGSQMLAIRRMFLNGSLSREKMLKTVSEYRADLIMKSPGISALGEDFIEPFSDQKDYDPETRTRPMMDKPVLPDEVLLEKEVKNLVAELRVELKRLFGYRAEMVDMYFGLGGYDEDEHNYRIIGEKFDLTLESVRQRVLKIFHEVRQAKHNRAALGLRGYIKDELTLFKDDEFDRLFYRL